MNLPTFPLFKKMEIGDRFEIESFTSRFPPFSDYNFVSLWSYNTNDDIMLSSLNGNLVVRFRDYIDTDKYVYSFMGGKAPAKTVSTLFTWMKTQNIPPRLGLIPEISIKDELERGKEFNVTEDRDNFDYVISVKELATLAGNINAHKRWKINKFLKNNEGVTSELLPIQDKKTHGELLSIFDLWAKAKKVAPADSLNERTAITRLLNDLPNQNLICVGVRIKGKLIGFSIEEILQNSFAIGHFMKIDFSDNSAYDYIRKVTADYLLAQKCNFLNCEQDLGEEGLRTAKQSLKPVYFLKKYIISPLG